MHAHSPAEQVIRYAESVRGEVMDDLTALLTWALVGALGIAVWLVVALCWLAAVTRLRR